MYLRNLFSKVFSDNFSLLPFIFRSKIYQDLIWGVIWDGHHDSMTYHWLLDCTVLRCTISITFTQVKPPDSADVFLDSGPSVL